MSQFKFAPEQFLGLQELTQFQKFILDRDVQRLKSISSSFGFVYSDNDTFFDNFKLSTSNSSLLITRTGYAIDKRGNTIIQQPTELTLPTQGDWYWVIASYQTTNIESGRVNISTDGTLTGIETKFTQVLRGQPNFATFIDFPDSAGNSQSYQVIEIIDDTNAIISGNLSQQSNQKYRVVGTFTPGTIQTVDQKYPYIYDSCDLKVVLELSTNQCPFDITNDLSFSVARVMSNGSGIFIQDKRNKIWSIKGQELFKSFLQSAIVGIESVCWNGQGSSRDENIVSIGYGFRSTDFSA
jgi:hypothetical protein